jgi:hypothetical protein
MRNFGTLVENHFSGFQKDLLLLGVVVDQGQWPVLLSVLGIDVKNTLLAVIYKGS